MRSLQNNGRATLWYAGGALVYAVVVITIITFFSLLLLSYLGINAKLANNVEKNTFNNYYLYSAIAGIVENNTGSQEKYILQLDKNQRVLVAKRKWGVYDYCNAILLSENDTIATCSALLGKSKNKEDSTALLIYNNTVKLHAGANVKLVGKIFAPSAIILNYQGYNGRHDINRLFKSPDTTVLLPGINALISQIRNLFEQNHYQAKTYLTGVINNSFLSSTQIIASDTIYVSGKLTGNIVLSANYIIVADSADIDNVVLVASKIRLSKGFSGCMQAFASDSIIVENKVRLLYPSSVVLIPEIKPVVQSRQKLMPATIIKDSVSIQGTVYAYLSKYTDMVALPLIYTGAGFHIAGGMYSNGAIDIRGGCYGAVVCNKIVQRRLAEDNLLLDTEINIDSLPHYFSYDSFFPISGSTKIVKWLK